MFDWAQLTFSSIQKLFIFTNSDYKIRNLKVSNIHTPLHVSAIHYFCHFSHFLLLLFPVLFSQHAYTPDKCKQCQGKLLCQLSIQMGNISIQQLCIVSVTKAIWNARTRYRECRSWEHEQLSILAIATTWSRESALYQRTSWVTNTIPGTWRELVYLGIVWRSFCKMQVHRSAVHMFKHHRMLSIGEAVSREARVCTCKATFLWCGPGRRQCWRWKNDEDAQGRSETYILEETLHSRTSTALHHTLRCWEFANRSCANTFLTYNIVAIPKIWWHGTCPQCHLWHKANWVGWNH